MKCFLFVCFDFYALQKWRVSYSSFQLLSTDAKTWRKASVLFSAVCPIDFFANLPRFLDVCVIWRRVQICMCRRGNGESCWRNRSRRPCPFCLPCVLGPGEERRPQCARCSEDRAGRVAGPAWLQRFQQLWAQEQAVSSLGAWGELFLLLATSFYCLVPQATLSSVVSWGTVD